MIEIKDLNETFIQIRSDKGIAMELNEKFAFFVPGYKYMPAYKNTGWDGKIYLFNLNNRTIYKGLLKYILEYFDDNKYEYTLDDTLNTTTEYSVYEALKFAASLNLSLEPYEYQIEAFCHAIRERRALFLSPTSSGKSLIIYLIARYFTGKRKLIIVPTISLVRQMEGDFKEYSQGEFEDILGITGKTDKAWKEDITNEVVISTWQSIQKMPKKFFEQFDVVMGDEAHTFQAKSLKEIMEKMPNCVYRYGFTGTIDDSLTNKLVLEGLFGQVYETISTKQLMDEGKVAKLKIKMLNLKYSKEIRQAYARKDYQSEIDFIIKNNKRNKFIKNLTLSLKGNTLILFQRVEHGKKLHELLYDENSKRKIFLAYGATDEDSREEIRKIVEKEKDAIIIASYGIFSTGVSIKAIHNIIFGSPYKSKIKVLQSIGRGLRVSAAKISCTLFDLADDLRWKSWVNHTLKHSGKRFQLYNKEKFDYKIYNIDIK
jgi:superfamily II DNA or RNA helicase